MSSARFSALALCCAIAGSAWSQAATAAGADYPSKAVRWVVPFTPGASNDIIARLIAAKLGDAWGQQFIIDNRAGAGGLVGADTVAKAAPDGYTLLLSNPGPNVNAPLLTKRSPYKVDDFAPIIFIGYAADIPTLSRQRTQGTPDYLKANPEKSTGVVKRQQPAHRACVVPGSHRVNVTHALYKGSGPAITDVSGQIQLMHTTTVSAETQIKLAACEYRSGKRKTNRIAA
jgi:tripartite-type tricarboxylate transporter receptor subunit TctC